MQNLIKIQMRAHTLNIQVIMSHSKEIQKPHS